MISKYKEVIKQQSILKLEKFMLWQLHNRTEIVIAVVSFVLGAVIF
jgi:hypothetical protein|tara:strand:- start:380 stop:517 length:138 start_codon:yes stop_codon:yes gene_type:complete